MNKGNFERELKKIMEEETVNIVLSQDLKDRILNKRVKTTREKIKDFLNREIEIPLVPLLASFGLAILLIGLPRDLIKRQDNFVTIDIGRSQIIVRDTGKVGGRDEN